jgi:acyl-CoA synthetase (AMP-forming)/AMP-acid ligase II
MRHKELYISGRLKDLIVCRGANVHPEDIEATAAQCHPAVGGGNAVFSIEAGNEEQVVLVQELPRPVPDDLDSGSLLAALSKAVAKEHGLHLYDAVLVRAGAIPRTTSGKVQRRRCGALYREGGFDKNAYAALRPLRRAPEPGGSAPETALPDGPETAP